MSRDDELVDALNRLGRTPSPPPDPAFANRLDAHLRTIHVDREPRPGRRTLVFSSLVGLAGVILAAVLSMSLLGDEPAVVVLTAAAETEVVLPGEAAIPGVPGQRLPDGTRIVVSSGGEAVVGGVVLDEDTEALVVGGRIEVLGGDGSEEIVATTRPVLRPEPTDSRPSSSTPDRPGDAGPSTTGSRPASTEGATTAPQPGDRTTIPPTSDDPDRPATTPTPTSTPATTPTTRPATTSSTVRPSTTDSRPRRAPSIDLTATPTSPDRIVLDWVVEAAADPDRWRIEAVVGDRVATLVVLRDGEARTTTVARIDARRVGFRVVALDADGNPLLTSELVAQPPS